MKAMEVVWVMEVISVMEVMKVQPFTPARSP
jgi:hypothetical protein